MTRVIQRGFFRIILLIIGLSWAIQSRSVCYAADKIKPKYGPEGAPFAVPLWSSFDYFNQADHKSVQFWGLVSYYIPEFTNGACSVASVSMVLNAARTRLKQTSEDKVVSQSDLLENIKVNHWKDLTTSILGYEGQHGVILDLLEGIIKESFNFYGLQYLSVKTVHISDLTSKTKESVVKDLSAFERDPDVFLISDFDQKSFTDDVHAGHIAPIGAYDSKNQKVLILDPDRDYFSPYWVSVDTFLSAMVTLDPVAGPNQHRGYVIIKIGKSKT